MATRKFSVTDAQAAELRRAYDRTKDGPTRTRYQAVRLYGSGYPVAQIAEITGCSRTSLMDWCRLHRTRGVPGLRAGPVGGHPPHPTSVQTATTRAAPHHHPPPPHPRPPTAPPPIRGDTTSKPR